MNKSRDSDGAYSFSFDKILDREGNILSEFSKPQISFFSSVSDKNPKEISIYEVLRRVQNGTYKNLVEQIRKAETKPKREALKKRLPAITVSGIFKDGHSIANLHSHSGLIQVDIDSLQSPNEIKEKLITEPYIFSCFISPSGSGVKAIIKIPTDLHDKTFEALEKHFLSKFGVPIDTKCKDVSRLMFFSYDSDIYINPDSIMFDNTAQQIEKILSEIETRNIDITAPYDNWLNIGFGFADSFGEAGRAYFHKVSKFNPEYSPDKCNTQYDKCLRDKKGITIRTFFKIAKDSGLNIKTSKSNSKLINKKQAISEPPSKFKMVEDYLLEKYDFRLNIVKNEPENKSKKEPKYVPLNEDNIFRELQHKNISFPLNNLTALFRSNFLPAFNPIIHYFENLPQWDGKTDYIGELCKHITAKDQERFNRHFKKHLVRCIACGIGVTFNKQAFILTGEQGTGKTTFIHWLCPESLNDYYAINISTDKDSLISLSENFIINLDELAGMHRMEINALKSMLSRDTVKIRRPYAKRATTDKRRANFFGSTNKDEFLTDETGSVRWLCFEVSNIDWKYKEMNINLIWAQAFNLYKSGFVSNLTSDEIKENETANSKHQITTLELELIQKCFIIVDKEDEQAEHFTATDIKLKIERMLPNQNLNIIAIGKALKTLGAKQTSERIGESKMPKKVYWLKPIKLTYNPD